MRDIGQHERETRNRARLPKPNGAAVIRFGKPRPLLPDGVYHAVCTSADWDWTKRYKRNQAKFLFAPPLDYDGPAYPGDLCALYPLAGRENYPYAAPGGKFYALWTGANGSTPAFPELSKAALKQMFEGSLCEIKVETVKRSWKAKKDEQDLPPELQYSVVREFRLAPLSRKQPAQPGQPVQPPQPAQPREPGQPPQPPNLTTCKPINKPCNQVTSKPPRFPEELGDEVSGATHAGSNTPGGTEKQISDSVPRSRTLPSCLACGSYAMYREKDGSLTCQSCSPLHTEVR